MTKCFQLLPLLTFKTISQLGRFICSVEHLRRKNSYCQKPRCTANKTSFLITEENYILKLRYKIQQDCNNISYIKSCLWYVNASTKPSGIVKSKTFEEMRLRKRHSLLWPLFGSYSCHPFERLKSEPFQTEECRETKVGKWTKSVESVFDDQTDWRQGRRRHDSAAKYLGSSPENQQKCLGYLQGQALCNCRWIWPTIRTN